MHKFLLSIHWFYKIFSIFACNKSYIPLCLLYISILFSSQFFHKILYLFKYIVKNCPTNLLLWILHKRLFFYHYDMHCASYRCYEIERLWDNFLIAKNLEDFSSRFRSRATRIRTLKWRSQSPLPYRLAIALFAVTFGIIHNICGFGKYFFRYFFIRLYFF